MAKLGIVEYKAGESAKIALERAKMLAELERLIWEQLQKLEETEIDTSTAAE